MVKEGPYFCIRINIQGSFYAERTLFQFYKDRRIHSIIVWRNHFDYDYNEVK